MNARTALDLGKETVNEFLKDKAPRLAAALSYYTIFSIAPLMIILIAVAALVLGQKGATEQVSYQLKDLLGEAGATSIQTMVESANRPKAGVVAAVTGVVVLLFGASGVFGQLQDALNTIWDVKAKEGGGFLKMLKDRFLSFSMILVVGFLLLVSLVLSAAIAAVGTMFQNMMPGMEVVGHILNFVVSFVVISFLFAMIFKILPDAEIGWHDVWLGAIATSFLFTLGKFGLGIYLGKGAVGSSYGAAGSLIVVLVWVYYSSMILLFGAEFTEVYSRHRVANLKR
ncbi:MAG: YihY/virulence factor BrkB family protein [Verrucomicrobiota bacterium]|nr:YihY/virulence factor BrkB family protein [Verrucomicrobiota bacterium]